MGRRAFWLAVPVALVLLCAYAAYIMFYRDWRGSFAPNELKMTAGVSGVPATLTVTLTNRSNRAFMVCGSPDLAPPFELELTPSAGGRALRPELPQGTPAGGPKILNPGDSASWSAPLARLFPLAGPGGYTLRATYDPEAAARRNEPCAAELTLGLVEAPPIPVSR